MPPPPLLLLPLLGASLLPPPLSWLPPEGASWLSWEAAAGAFRPSMRSGDAGAGAAPALVGLPSGNKSSTSRRPAPNPLLLLLSASGAAQNAPAVKALRGTHPPPPLLPWPLEATARSGRRRVGHLGLK
jgi:hypothetical protein